MAKMGISWSFVLTQYSKFASFVRVWCLLTTKGLDTCVGSQMDLCYPVLIRPSPICLAFAVSTKPLSSRCGQGSCYPEPVAVWNRGWHIRALGALSFWGSIAGPLWVIVIRGRGCLLNVVVVPCSSAFVGRELGELLVTQSLRKRENVC